MQTVLLPPISGDMYSGGVGEPQYVTIREPNSAMILIDSGDCDFELTKEKMTVSSQQTLTSQPNILAQGIKRLTVTATSSTSNIPNVNPRNNHIVLIYGGTKYEVDIPIGSYATSQTVADAIKLALNTVTATSAFTVPLFSPPLYPDTYVLTSSGSTFYIDKSSTVITKGRQMYAFGESQVAASTQPLGAMGLVYSKYVDYISRRLTQYTKLRTTSTKNTANILMRATKIKLSDLDYGIDKFGFGAYVGTTSLNWEPSDPISSFDITVLDQNGDLLYVPSNEGGLGGQGDYAWQMYIKIEF